MCVCVCVFIYLWNNPAKFHGDTYMYTLKKLVQKNLHVTKIVRFNWSVVLERFGYQKPETCTK